MPQTITASVGRNARNLNPDVKTVQQLLNGVFPQNGGPQPLLDKDGLIGPKTKNAIQRFQLHHFGWSGADGRVDPDHQTIDKLNELNGSPTQSYYFLYQQSKRRGVMKRSNPQDWFFKIQVVPTPYRVGRLQFGIFWFGPAGRVPGAPPNESVFRYEKTRNFTTAKSCTMDDLVGPALIHTPFRPANMPQETGGSLQRKLSPRFSASLFAGLDPTEPPGPGVIFMPIGDITIIEYRAQLHRIK